MKEDFKFGLRWSRVIVLSYNPLIIICALIDAVRIPRTLTNRRCEPLSNRHYDLSEDENQHALPP